MSFEAAFSFLSERGYADRVQTFSVSSATVDLAAKALGISGAHIAKSLTFMVDERPVMVLFAGDAKVDNHKYKAFFGKKAKMMTPEEVETHTGHRIGGVCPFGAKPGLDIYLDQSLRRFSEIYPACGSDNSAVRLTPEELEELSGAREWIDVSKLPPSETDIV